MQSFAEDTMSEEYQTMKTITHSLLLAAAIFCLSASGCILGSLDMMGVESVLLEDEDLDKDPSLEDDRIEDKHPEYDPDRWVEETFGGCRFELNKSAAVTRLDILPFEGQDKHLETDLFPTRGEAFAALAGSGAPELIPSMEVVNGFLKPVNDGLYAALELASQDGVGELWAGKQEVLVTWLGALETLSATATAPQREHIDRARVFLAAGLELGGGQAALDSGLRGRVDSVKTAFSGFPLLARPIGFYTWNETLGRVFRQDRFLQNRGVDPGMNVPALETEFGVNGSAQQLGLFAALAFALVQDPALEEDYSALVALYAGLTNPYSSHPVTALVPYVTSLSDLDDLAGLGAQFHADNPEPYVCSGVDFAVLPASRSKDTNFFKDLFCGGSDPDASFMDLLIEAIRDGSLDLAPDAASGWYDYQLYAMETLLLPERAAEKDNLLLTSAYKKKLIETFKSILIQTRETHVKSLEMATDGSAAPTPVDIYPKLPVEPFPTFYLRTARGYRFLATYLRALVGDEVLGSLRRLREDGSEGDTLLSELGAITRRMYGIAHLSARHLGLDFPAMLLEEELIEHDLESCTAAAETWLASWTTDRDVRVDPRVIVPVGKSGSDAVYWAVIGVRALRIQAEFVEGHEPEVEALDWCFLGELIPKDYSLLVEKTIEVRLPLGADPPTRAELRAICDAHGTEEAIRAALEAL
ncbi:MAG: hypothetical protein RBU30_21975 [Polyangia bacterium]|jgi:hypothetical protein|nr:hypothetical protein [Polyangia bacterium]